MDPLEGLVLSTIGYEDGGRVRPIVYRASVSEMVVPYGHPSPMHQWKSAFDAGEWGLGRMANSLTLGCDCLGEIHYFDDVFADERCKPRTKGNAICMHEEDYSILWKHNDMMSGRSEVRRSRRLVISSIATVGNYEYGFYWYFYLDGTMQLEVKLTGIMSTMAVEGDDPGEHARMVAPGLAAPFHQHLFNVRLDVEVDGADNAVFEVDAVPSPPGEGNPVGSAFGVAATLLDTELAARRDVDPGRSRTWRIVNRSRRNGLGQPTAYKLLPGATPTLLAGPESSIGRRAAFAAHNLWVTPFHPDERHAAGDYSEPAHGRGGSAGLDRTRPVRGRHRHRALAFLRDHPCPTARGLAGDARRIHRLHVDPLRLLRSQPGPRRAPLGRALRWLSTGPTPTRRRSTTPPSRSISRRCSHWPRRACR